jgi:hypothetical protein
MVQGPDGQTVIFGGIGDPPSASETVDVANIKIDVARIKRTIVFIGLSFGVAFGTGTGTGRHLMCIPHGTGGMFENRAIHRTSGPYRG